MVAPPRSWATPAWLPRPAPYSISCGAEGAQPDLLWEDIKRPVCLPALQCLLPGRVLGCCHLIICAIISLCDCVCSHTCKLSLCKDRLLLPTPHLLCPLRTSPCSSPLPRPQRRRESVTGEFGEMNGEAPHTSFWVQPGYKRNLRATLRGARTEPACRGGQLCPPSGLS